MKKINLVNLVLFAGIALLAYGLTIYFESLPPQSTATNPGETAAPLPNEQAPDFTFTATDGKTYKRSDFTGKIVILNFWASWCAPCIEEFPRLLDAARNDEENIILIALSSDLDENAMNNFMTRMKKKGTRFDGKNIFIAFDTDQAITQKMFQTYRLPETVIIDTNGMIRHKLIGSEWTTASLQRIIMDLK